MVLQTLSVTCFLYTFLGSSSAASEDFFVYPNYFNLTSDAFVGGSFPAWFKFGVASSAYQTEGAWDADGKGRSIWDTWTHDPANAEDGNGDDADKSYEFWDVDIGLLRSLGVDHYRFSLSWTRLIPNGTIQDPSTDINTAGIDHYYKFIDALVEAGIEPIVTMIHWDLPQALQDLGGWISSDLPTWFEEYADLCFKSFGDRVKIWLTFNEPYTTSRCFESANCPPGISAPGILSYQSVHLQLLAHARAFKLYNEKYRSIQGGKVGIVCNTGWHEALDDSNLNVYSSERALQFSIGWVLSPLLGSGDYPEVMRNVIDELSDYQGFPESRLPTFSADDKAMVLGSLDFLAYNYYGSDMTSYESQVYSMEPSYANDLSIKYSFPSSWAPTSLSWTKTYPVGLRKVLNWIMAKYGQNYQFEIFITENGFPSLATDPTEEFACENSFDLERMKYMVAHLDQLNQAIQEDGIPVTRYTHWALMDVFSFGSGYNIKFGLYCVNYKSEERFRMARFSAMLYNEIIHNRGFESSNLMDSLKQWGVLELLH